MANTDFSPPYFPNISRHFMNFSFSSSRNSASTQARKYSEPKQSSQQKIVTKRNENQKKLNPSISAGVVPKLHVFKKRNGVRPLSGLRGSSRPTAWCCCCWLAGDDDDGDVELRMTLLYWLILVVVVVVVEVVVKHFFARASFRHLRATTWWPKSLGVPCVAVAVAGSDFRSEASARRVDL